MLVLLPVTHARFRTEQAKGMSNLHMKCKEFKLNVTDASSSSLSHRVCMPFESMVPLLSDLHRNTPVY